MTHLAKIFCSAGILPAFEFNNTQAGSLRYWKPALLEACATISSDSFELGFRTDESDILPNLQQKDNYIECQLCFQRFEYESASAIGKKYIQINLGPRKNKFDLPNQDDQTPDEKQPSR